VKSFALAAFIVLSLVLIVGWFEPLYWGCGVKNTTQLRSTLEFLKHKSPLPQGYTQEEASHLYDVKRVLSWLTAVWIIAGLVSMLCKPSRRAADLLIAVSSVGLISAAGFAKAFELFHLFAFPQGNYSFPQGSLILEIFPFCYFTRAYLAIFGFAFVIGVFGKVFIYILKKRSP
jgi:uncharacterized membrane protein